MIDYIECEQGSEQWHLERAGCITASKVTEIRSLVGGLTEQQQQYVDAIMAGCSEGAAMSKAGYKKTPTASAVARALRGEQVADYSAEAKNYAFRLAIERVSGLPLDDDEFSPWQGARGIRLEPEARAEHEIATGVMVMPMGLIRTQDRRFAASVDGLIGDDEGAEYKCFLAPGKLRPILLEHDVSGVADQAQFAMAITGRKRWHVGLYCPALRVIGRHLTLVPIDRDENYIDSMWADLMRFDRLVEAYRAELAGQSAVTEMARPVAEPAAEATTLEPTF